MHFHTPFHPFQGHRWAAYVDATNLILILAGLLLAFLLGPLLD